MPKKSRAQPLAIIGWREFLTLPQLGNQKIKAKIDTGARSSALHAFDLKITEEQGKSIVEFKVHPDQRNTKQTIIAKADLFDRRKVRSSNGQSQLRPVIQTPVQLGNQQWLIELTLTNRDEMGFRMLLGRQAIQNRFLVDVGQSFLHSKNYPDSTATHLSEEI